MAQLHRRLRRPSSLSDGEAIPGDWAAFLCRKRYADLCRVLIWGYLTTVRDEWRELFATVGVSVADALSGVVTLRL